MAAVKSKNTSPELVVRKIVHSLGFRYRLHVASLPGAPDLVFPRLRKIILIHGCFWHMHTCGACRIPSPPQILACQNPPQRRPRPPKSPRPPPSRLARPHHLGMPDQTPPPRPPHLQTLPLSHTLNCATSCSHPLFSLCSLLFVILSAPPRLRVRICLLRLLRSLSLWERAPRDSVVGAAQRPGEGVLSCSRVKARPAAGKAITIPNNYFQNSAQNGRNYRPLFNRPMGERALHGRAAFRRVRPQRSGEKDRLATFSIAASLKRESLNIFSPSHERTKRTKRLDPEALKAAKDDTNSTSQRA